jgi:preprotein translocase subunit SecG
MMTFLGTVHLIACIALIILAMMQDSKGGGMFSSQTSSNSVLGATGGASLAVTMTKILSVIILVTCVSIAMIYTNANKSVVDGSVMGGSPAPTTVPAAAAVSADNTQSK